MPKAEFVIGLDFDNTLVSYDKAMRVTALELGFISEGVKLGSKEEVRDYLRKLPGGEIKWQQLQAEIYGRRMHQAQLIDGVKAFLLTCREYQVPVFIVSHKSKYAAQDKDGINLQEAAFNWMKQNGFFDKDGLGLLADRVYFEESRNNKVLRIKELACTHFVDDLREVFEERNFPLETKRFLFAPGQASVGEARDEAGVRVFGSWEGIHQFFFVQQV